MTTDSLIVGSLVNGVMVVGPEPILKAIMSAPGLLLAARIASRRLQSAGLQELLVSAVLVTVNVCWAWATQAAPTKTQRERNSRQKARLPEIIASNSANIFLSP